MHLCLNVSIRRDKETKVDVASAVYAVFEQNPAKLRNIGLHIMVKLIDFSYLWPWTYDLPLLLPLASSVVSIQEVNCR